MTALIEALEKLLSSPGLQIVDGLRVTGYPSGVLNIDRHEGALTKQDVVATRAAFADLGYDEAEAWLPRQGMSWLSEGVSAGVSFRLRKKDLLEQADESVRS